jgi:hypothetical protein
MNRFNISLLAACLATCLFGASTSVLAASTTQKAQQAKFGECSHQAKVKGLKGPDFKSFMHTCASGSAGMTAPVSATNAACGTGSTIGKPMSQTDKMKTCNADAKTKGLKGTDRKDFMKSCLSG